MATASSATPAPAPRRPTPAAATTAKDDAGLLPILVLAAAQFVMVLDSSVMNVSISQIVADLNTTVQGVQAAITFYTLVMAALMLLGAKLGDVLGRTRAFSLGLGIYGLGSLTTALSPSLTVLLIGWSTIEGIGAALVIPAIMALIVATYTGRRRATAFGIVGGAAGAAIATGPLIGGWVTTELSWRYVFVGEVVVVIAVLIARRRILPDIKPVNPPKLDLIGAALAGSGLALAVFGILKSSTWGWIEPLAIPKIGGHEITPLGFSLVPFLILAGVGLLLAFAAWEERKERAGEDALLDRTLLRIPPLRAGLSALAAQQLTLLGTFFVLPVYLQLVLGLDAFETGKRLFPMSVTMFVAALAGPRLAAGFAPKRVAQAGFAALAGGAFLLLDTIAPELDGSDFTIALALFGLGAGLLISQLGNIIMSASPEAKATEAGGLQGTAQNLGASLGTALIGSILIAALTSGFTTRVEQNPAVPQAARTELAATAHEGIPVVATDDVEAAARKAGASAEQARAIAADYSDAELDALRRALGAVGALSLLSLWFTRRLPGRPDEKR
jgi:EmrB/QacA subfamily drug resistance transporter